MNELGSRLLFLASFGLVAYSDSLAHGQAIRHLSEGCIADCADDCTCVRYSSCVNPKCVPRKCISAKKKICCYGSYFFEGPMVLDGNVYFSSVFRGQILTTDLETFGTPQVVPYLATSQTNGLAAGKDPHSIIVCQMGTANSCSPKGLFEYDVQTGLKKTLVTRNHRGQPLNSPNDLAVVADSGDIYITDPDLPLPDKSGLLPKFKTHGEPAVYFLKSGSCKPKCCLRGIDKPNGIAVSGKYLYVVASGRHSRLLRFRLDGPGCVDPRAECVCLDSNSGDGMAIHPERGEAFVTAGSKIRVIDITTSPMQVKYDLCLRDSSFTPSNLCFVNKSEIIVTAYRLKRSYLGFLTRKSDGLIGRYALD